MKKIVKVVCLMLVAVMAMGACVACGQPAPAAPEAAGTADAAVGEAEAADQPAAPAEGDVTVNYRTFRTDDEAVMQELIAKFETENPGIKINYAAERDETAYYQKLQADMLSGQDVDVFDAHPRADFSMMVNSGNVLDISDLEFNKNYDPGIAAVSSIGGKNYGYIPAVNLMGIFYNKGLFEEMGVTVPTTYDELKAVVEKSKAAGYGGISYCGATVVGTWMANLLLNQTMQTQKMHDDYWVKIGNGEVTNLNDIPEARMVFDTIAAINKDELLYDNADGIQFDQSIALFTQGKAAMMMMGTWEFANLGSVYKDIDVGVFTMPSMEGSEITHAEPGQIVSIYAKSLNMDAAKKWVEFLAAPENAQIYTTFARTTPTIEGVEADFEGIEILNELKAKGISALPLNDAENFDIWGNIIINMYTNLLFGSGDADAELAEVDKLLQAANFGA